MDGYFAAQSTYLETRKEQLRRLFGFLAQHVPLQGERIVSIGCGVAADLILLECFRIREGVDHHPGVIAFCRKAHRGPSFHHAHHVAFLAGVPDHSIDLLLALDIDSNLLPEELVRQALPKLKAGGHIVMTERQDNLRIYRRLLIDPVSVRRVAQPHPVRVFTRIREQHPDDRDNVVIIVRSQHPTP